MSSPYIPGPGEVLEHNAGGSPIQSPTGDLEQQEPTLRPMRLKVLYSSDPENKTNCLAKWPEILNIRTAYLNEQTQIGVIELKTCIQAIVTASPELDCKYGQDYTIYAYDYSEYETPLVGQGMLSRALASISSTPTAPAHESDTIVTGRVCKNPLGLFGKGIQEVLEVKLRLVPVPTKLQPQYVETMKQQRDLNNILPEGCDPRAWQEFLRQNPGMLAVLGQQRSHSPALSTGQQHGIEQVQRLVSEGYRPQSAHRNASYAGSAVSGGSHRSGSPTPSLQSMATTQPFATGARPVSRASDRVGGVRSRRQSVSGSTEYTYDDERTEDGPQRKRAKVVKADHPGRANMGNIVDSLRITASTAASVRVLQPAAIRPGVSAIRSLEGPPRVPTPTPGSGFSRRRVAPKGTRSGLGREPTLTSDSGYKSLASDDGNVFMESAGSSPENAIAQSDCNSPDDVASSPPIFGNPITSIAPSSPVLPAMPVTKKSALSGTDHAGSDGNVFVDKAWIDESSKVAAAYTKQPPLGRRASSTAIGAEVRRPVASQAQLDEEARQKEVSMRNARRAIGLKRAQTWSGDQPSSDPVIPERPQVPARSDCERPKSRNTNWNKEKRKAAMQSKLQESIEAGQMPQFCENCGAIETPTWRKAYSRIYSGDPEDLKALDEEGAILNVQILESHEDGSPKLFKIFRKVVPSGEEGYSDVVLCNPCGIWLSNHKCMRPQTHWGKRKHKGGDKSKDKRSRGKKRQDDGKMDLSDLGNLLSEDVNPASEMTIDNDDNPVLADAMDFDIPQLPPMQLPLPDDDSFLSTDLAGLGSSLDASDFAALERAVRASPGTARKSPRHVEKQSGDPARRTLFPSPKSDGPLGVNVEEKMRGAKDAPKTFNERRSGSADAVSEGKEVRAASIVESEDAASDTMPMTPSRKSDSLALRKHIFEAKTPLPKSSPAKTAMTTGDFFSSAAKAFLHAPQTPRTPSRNNGQEERTTPFSRHLSQLFADAQAEGKGELDDLNLPPLGERMTPGRMLGHDAFAFGDYSSDLPNFPSSPGWFEMAEGAYDDASLGPDWRSLFGSAQKPRMDTCFVDVQDGDGRAAAASFEAADG